MKKETKKENRLGFLVLILCLFICFISIGYALWQQVFKGEKVNELNTATLILTLDESTSNGISLLNLVPVTDKKGQTFTPHTFKVKNSGTTDANYRLLIVNDTKKHNEDSCSDNKLQWSNIKYSLSKNGEAATTALLSDTAGVLNMGKLGVGQTDSYSLKLWIKSEAGNEIMNQHFHGLIRVEAIQGDQALPS